jgi:hypothetical protein
MNHEVLEKRIILYKNLIENPVAFIQEIENLDSLLQENSQISKWKTWYSSDENPSPYGVWKNGIEHNFLNETDIDIRCSSIVNVLKNSIDSCVDHYSKLLNIEPGGRSPEFNIKKYNQKQSMGAHIDYQEDPNKPQSTISIVFYLNDDYEGGEIGFPNHDIKIKPKAGSLIIFPSTAPYYHESHVLLSGNKYMSLAFYFKDKELLWI